MRYVQALTLGLSALLLPTAGCGPSPSGSKDAGPSASVGSLSGTVRDPRGQPIGDAKLKVSGREVNADFQGKYQIDAGATGSTTITVSAPWFADKQQSVEIT